MLSTLSTADVLANSDVATPFRTGETMQVWSTPFAELDLEKKLAVQVQYQAASPPSSAPAQRLNTSLVDAPSFSIPW